MAFESSIKQIEDKKATTVPSTVILINYCHKAAAMSNDSEQVKRTIYY